jgi:hypothetical protein
MLPSKYCCGDFSVSHRYVYLPFHGCLRLQHFRCFKFWAKRRGVYSNVRLYVTVNILWFLLSLLSVLILSLQEKNLHCKTLCVGWCDFVALFCSGFSAWHISVLCCPCNKVMSDDISDNINSILWGKNWCFHSWMIQWATNCVGVFCQMLCSAVDPSSYTLLIFSMDVILNCRCYAL